MSYFPYDEKTGTQSSKSYGNDNEFEYNFFISCRYLYLVKKSENNNIANRKFTRCYNIKILNRLCVKIHVIFIELCNEKDPFLPP